MPSSDILGDGDVTVLEEPEVHQKGEFQSADSIGGGTPGRTRKDLLRAARGVPQSYADDPGCSPSH